MGAARADLAAKLADAFVVAAGRIADRSPSAMPTAHVRDRLAEELRAILPAIYEAGRRDEWVDGFGEPALERELAGSFAAGRAGRAALPPETLPEAIDFAQAGPADNAFAQGWDYESGRGDQ